MQLLQLLTSGCHGIDLRIISPFLPLVSFFSLSPVVDFLPGSRRHLLVSISSALDVAQSRYILTVLLVQ